jgi:hypothetical protein
MLQLQPRHRRRDANKSGAGKNVADVRLTLVALAYIPCNKSQSSNPGKALTERMVTSNEVMEKLETGLLPGLG